MVSNGTGVQFFDINMGDTKSSVPYVELLGNIMGGCNVIARVHEEGALFFAPLIALLPTGLAFAAPLSGAIIIIDSTNTITIQDG